MTTQDKTLISRITTINKNSDNYDEYREGVLAEIDNAIAHEKDKDKLDNYRTIRFLVETPDTADIEYVHNQILDMLE